MIKIDKDIKKRWLTFALVNFVLTVLIFGAVLAGFSAYVVMAQRSQLETGALAYAQELASLGKDKLTLITSEDVAYIDENPSFSFALYTVRNDGSIGIASDERFIENNTPVLGGKAGEFAVEEVGGHRFLTVAVAVNDSTNDYVKVFAPFDAVAAANETIKTYCAPFVVLFLLIAAAFSLIWGYLSIKPIMSGYIKQKNFINDMSHEIRTPLAVIKGNLENILAMPDATVGQVADMLQGSLKEVDYMSDISSGLLNIVRGRNRSGSKETHLSDVVSDAVDMFADMAAMSNKSLVANLEYCDIPVEREKIKQLLSVLIENSVKYTREGDRISVRLKNTKDGCVLTVSDTGIGVPKNELENIFDRFFRASNTENIAGTGLGLSIAQAIVEGMGGTIKAAPNVPSGLEIIVQLKRN